MNNNPSALQGTGRYLLRAIGNVALAFALYMLCRAVYLAENWHLYADGWHALSLWQLLVGGLRFDAAAICYTNLLYLLLILLPCRVRERRGYQLAAKWLFVVVNGLALCLNLIDTVYSQYTGRRTTASFFREFSHEGNLAGIFGIELLNHWYLTLAAVAMAAALWRLYRMPAGGRKDNATARRRTTWQTVIVDTAALCVAFILAVAGLRGGLSYHRPIAITTANRYVNQPVETNIVLNTPFTLIRTIGKTSFHNPNYFATQTEAETLFTPLHQPAAVSGAPDSLSNPRNIVILILESFGMEYFGAYNQYVDGNTYKNCIGGGMTINKLAHKQDLDGGTYRGYTPFLDSLIGHSLWFPRSFANGRKSIDAMPSVLSSIPMFVEPYILTDAALNDISGLAGELDKTGYRTAFFHGADNGSMGFLEFSQTTGFQEYYGLNEYCADSRFDGMADFDGEWGIFDEPFLHFAALKLTEFEQPFMMSLFTVTSHHPFPLPEQYKGLIPEGTMPIHRGIQYTDNALRQFFSVARQQPWYDNTIFVITADHTNATEHPEYATSLGAFRVPIIFYDPSGRMPQGQSNAIAQQIDIMPTLLEYVGYRRPYIAFGTNLLRDGEQGWAVNYQNGIYQYIEGNLMLQFDGNATVGLYRYVDDPLLQDNLAGTLPDDEARLAQRLKAIVQSYMCRMASNSLLPSNSVATTDDGTH